MFSFFAEWLPLSQASNVNLGNPVEKNLLEKMVSNLRIFWSLKISSNKIEIGKYLQPDTACQQNTGLPV